MSYAVARQQIALLRWQSAHVPTELGSCKRKAGRGERKCETLWERIGCRAYWEINWQHIFRLQLNLSNVSLPVAGHWVRYDISPCSTFPKAAVLHSLLTLALERYKQSGSRSGPVPLRQDAGWAPETFGKFWKRSFLEIIDSSPVQTVQTVPATLCRALHHFQTSTSFRKIYRIRPFEDRS
jgi:hypothetical protein